MFTKDGHHERTFQTKAAARAWRTDAMKAAKDGKRVKPSATTFAECAAAWLAGATAEPPTVLNRSGRAFKPSALRSIEADLNRYLIPRWGSHRLSDIGRRDVQALVDELVGEGRSASRVRNVTNAARVIFNRAIDEEQITVSPCTNLRLPANVEPVNRASEPTDLFAWLDAMTDDLRVLYGVAAFAGLRRGELRGLTWADVESLDGTGPLAGWLHVNRSYDDVAGFVSPKSRSSKRGVPIVRGYLSDLIDAHRARRPTTNDEHHVFPGRFGPDSPFKDVEGAVRAAVKAANTERAEAGKEPLRVLGMHACRHTFGSLCRAAGVSDGDISDFLGHSRATALGVTARYTHSIELDMRDAHNAEKLVAYLRRVDTGARVAMMDDAAPAPVDDLAAQLIARFGDDPAALDRLLDTVRAGVLVTGLGR